VNSIVFLRVSIGRIIEWLIVALLVVTLWPLCSRGEDGQLTAFHGGHYRSELFLSNGLLAGMGSRTASLGGTCTGLRYGAEDLYWNPGRLGLLDRPEAMLDLTPPLVSLDAQSFVDIDGLAQEAVDDLADEKGSPDLVLEPGDYPQVSARLGQRGLIPNGILTLPAGGWGVGIGLHQALSLELEAVGTELQAKVYGEDPDDPENDVDLTVDADLSLISQVQVSALGFGLGREILPGWSLGLLVNRYFGSSTANGRLQTEGIILRAGRETAFNDPADPWPNDLYQEMAGSYRGTGWGLKTGTSFRLRPNLSLDGTLTLPTRIELRGEMDIVQHTVPGLDLSDDDPLDADQVDLDEPTRTETVDNPTADQVAVNLPGSLCLGAAWRYRFVTALLQYAHYFGEYSCRYHIAEADLPVAYTAGLRPGHVLTLGLETGPVRLSGGFILGQAFYERDPEKEEDAGEEPDEEPLTVPTFSLGTGFALGSGYRVDLLLISVPAGVMRATTTWTF
jgi:hypothetical protein